MKNKLLQAFPAFSYRNYQLYFAGQSLSLIGTWLQIVAQGWLVWQLSHSALWVGIISAIGSLPVLFFSLFGGVVVDRLHTKSILLFTQSLEMFLALTFGILTVYHVISIILLAILTFFFGVVSALDMPARQAFMVEIIDKKHLSSAIAVNSGTFNGARVVGPAVAGILIATIGTGGAFIVNGISFIPAIIALLLIRVARAAPQIHSSPIQAIREGLLYAFTHPIIKTLLIFAGITSVFGWSYATIMPVIAQNVFHQGATGLGYLYVASGLGSVVSTILVSIYGNKISSNIFIIGGSFLFSMAVISFSFTSFFPLALFFLFFAGMGLVVQFSMMNTLIQQMVENNIRGRVMSIYMLMFLGISPIGSFLIGFLSQHLGSMLSIRLSVSIVFLYTIYLFFIRKKIQKNYVTYSSENDASKELLGKK